MDAAFEQMAWVYRALVVVVVLIPSARHRLLGGAGLALLGLGAAAGAVGAVDATSSTFTSVNELIAGAGVFVVTMAVLKGWRAARGAGGSGETPGSNEIEAVPPGDGPRLRDPLLWLGIGLVAAGPHLLVVALGAGVLLLSGVRAALGSGRRGALVPVAGAAVLLVAAFWFMLTVLGEHGGRVADLGSGPWSIAAERMVVPLLGVGGFLLAGLAPFHRLPWRLSLAPVGALLLARVMIPAFPDGMRDWQAPAMLIAAACLLAAAVGSRWPEAAVAGGYLALWSGREEAIGAGLVLAGWGWLVELSGTAYAGWIESRSRWAGVAAVIPALAALPALEAGLGSQVVISAAAALGMAVLLLAKGRRPEDEGAG